MFGLNLFGSKKTVPPQPCSCSPHFQGGQNYYPAYEPYPADSYTGADAQKSQRSSGWFKKLLIGAGVIAGGVFLYKRFDVGTRLMKVQQVHQLVDSIPAHWIQNANSAISTVKGILPDTQPLLDNISHYIPSQDQVMETVQHYIPSAETIQTTVQGWIPESLGGVGQTISTAISDGFNGLLNWWGKSGAARV